MRYAFILLAMCIGIATEFSSPSGELELTNTTSNGIQKQKYLRKNLSFFVSGKPNTLQNNRTDIDETALYEHAATKNNNLNERAFIYLNQKYKKPSLHQYFRFTHNGRDYHRSIQLPPSMPQATIQRLNEPCKSKTVKVNSYYQGYDYSDRSPDVASYFVKPPPPVQSKNKWRPYNNNERLSYLNTLINQKRDYIELLKSPLLGILTRKVNDTKYDGIPEKFPLINYKGDPNLRNNTYKEKHNLTDTILVDKRRIGHQTNYGFNTPYNHNAGYQVNDASKHIDRPQFESGFLKDNDFKTQEEDLLLDQYLKNTLKDQVTSNEKPMLKNHHECNLQSINISSGTNLNKNYNKPGCKSEQHLNLRQGDANLQLNTMRPEREGNKFNESNSLLKSLDITYYEQLLSED